MGNVDEDKGREAQGPRLMVTVDTPKLSVAGHCGAGSCRPAAPSSALRTAPEYVAVGSKK